MWSQLNDQHQPRHANRCAEKGEWDLKLVCNQLERRKPDLVQLLELYLRRPLRWQQAMQV